jgi:hypothetical protein
MDLTVIMEAYGLVLMRRFVTLMENVIVKKDIVGIIVLFVRILALIYEN